MRATSKQMCTEHYTALDAHITSMILVVGKVKQIRVETTKVRQLQYARRYNDTNRSRYLVLRSARAALS